ncbi:hypothetical protein QBC46DRAFT_351135 [Diplogelasinospora grovesii]|uniref:Uncharacterized protein n=1 Tax=Diplogelasinospora grovesii TaxID=303347 RepID=A0AAN6S8F0_9PEZI|nr:hypothetical protein QBC46DRAFT_351135 [Diplogelasinospora grovesii]
MKASTIFATVFATLAAAAPTTAVEKRSNFDLSGVNNLSGFNQVNLNYLLNINSLDLQLLQTLGSVNNFNVLSFQSLFQQNSFDLNSLLQLQQLQMLLQLESLGLFNGFDLSSLNLNSLQFGLINNVNTLDLSQFIPSNVVTQVQTIASQVVPSGPGSAVVPAGADIVTAADEAAQDGAASVPGRL